MQNKNVTVYIDVANLVLTARDVNIKYDIEKLLKYFLYKYNANKCIYFTAYFQEFEAEYKRLEKLGVEIFFRELAKSKGVVKADCDVDISNRITLDIEHGKTDEIVLVTCDGDFGNLLDYAKSKLAKVSLFAVAEKKTSGLLKKRQYLNIIYLENIAAMLLKGKGPAIHERIEGTLFSINSITGPQNLSTPTVVAEGGNKLEKEYKFVDFVEAMDFVNKVAKVAEEMQHHPEIEVKYDVVEIETTTHDAGDVVTEKDIDLVKQIDAIYQNYKN